MNGNCWWTDRPTDRQTAAKQYALPSSKGGIRIVSILDVHILKILKYVMTLAATVARRRNISGHLVLQKQRFTKNEEKNPFSNPHVSEKKNPQYDSRYQP
jgi:hypothetical protein